MIFLLAKERTVPAPFGQPRSIKRATCLRDPEVSERVDELMDRLTLADKVGEMTQLAIDMVSVGEPYRVAVPHRLDEEKLKNVLLDLRVGSILNVSGHAYTLDHWRHIIHQVQDLAINQKPSGIPVLYGIDTIHGANYTLGSTLFPQQIGLAATWNPETARACARIGAYETRASGIPWVFSPVLDIGRDPRWARFWETFGEDVHLSESMGQAMIEGYQGSDISHPHRVAATMKHFLGYSTPITGKDRTQAWIPERQLREYFLPSFKAAIDAGALTVMINSGEINGVPVHANKRVLTGLLRDELGFEGLALTDWEDIRYLFTRHKVANDYKDAIRIAINAGIDMSMVPTDTEYPKLLRELVEEGKVPMSRIDESVRRILTLKFKLGLFEYPYHPDKRQYLRFGSESFAESARKAAAESITLLKNEASILPLSSNCMVLVTGPAANSLTRLNGGWSRTWQGDDPQFDNPEKKTIYGAMSKMVGEEFVTHLPDGSDTESIKKAAHKADVAVVCVGESPYAETPGDLNDLWLSEDQRALVRSISTTGVPVVLVLIEGRPRIISDIEPEVKGIIHGYLPGENGSEAIADVLYGNVNPSGRLPYTYPRHPNDLVSYDHKHSDNVKGQVFNVKELAFNPQWPFGYGLSYTSFHYDNLWIDREEFSNDDMVTISVEVTNTGQRSGKETVQLFVSDLVASITPPVKRLRGYKKVKLRPGEMKKVEFMISAENLAFVGIDHQWTTEPGDFTIQIGPLFGTITYVR